MKQDLAQNLIEAGMRIDASAIQGQNQCASSKGDGKAIFMLACVATDREMAQVEAFLKKITEVEAGLKSQGCTIILQARLPDGGPMERRRPGRARKDDFVDMTRTSSGEWRFNRGDDYEKQSVSVHCSVRPSRREAATEDGSGSPVQARTLILPFPAGRRTIRKGRSFQASRGLPDPKRHN